MIAEVPRAQMSPATKMRPPHGASRSAVVVAILLSALHLLNYLNYTFIAGYFNPPLTRSALLVAAAVILLARSSDNLRFHVLRSWDMYLICVVALVSAAYASDPGQTLKYGAWLLLAVYVGTELAARTRTADDVIKALAIVLLPASLLVATANVTLGPVVTTAGRHFGALGSTHVDTAYAMDFICLFLAMRAIPEGKVALPKWLRLALWGVLAWSFYQVIFGLTRSVWLGVLLTLFLYHFRKKLNFKTLASAVAIAFVVLITVDLVGLDRIVPDAVRARVEVTEQRYQSGQIDPRLEGIRFAFEHALEHPEGAGYAMKSSHNSYMNILLNLGWVGFVLAMIAVARSLRMVGRLGFGWFVFFGIGSAALLLHAFFEVQDLPGQANFVPLLLWYALSRSRFVTDRAAQMNRRRTRFVR